MPRHLPGSLFEAGKPLQLVVGLYLVYDRAHYLECPAVLGIACRSDEVHAFLLEEFLGCLVLAGKQRVVYCNGVSAEHLHNLHARHICLSVSEIYHVRERYPLVFLQLALIDQLVVTDAEDALVDLENELCLRRIVYCHTWPDRIPVLVIQE